MTVTTGDDARQRGPQHGPAVWRTADVASEDSWRISLDETQRQTIVDAARRAVTTDTPLHSLTAQTFPLAGMEADLERWSTALGSGRGFLLIQNFPVDLLDERGTEVAYLGLGAHLGTPVGQNSEGELITHVRDERLPASAGTVRRYRTRQRQDFHTDAADIIGLLCLHRARQGGQSKLASSWAIYNAMLEQRPDLLDALYTPVGWDRQGDVPAGQSPWFLLAPLSNVSGAPRLFYVGWYIRDSQQHPDAPRIGEQQLEAMEMLERLANDPTFHLEMDFQPGDVQLVNNGRILHARDAYEDHDDPARRRHLLRLWLAAHRFQSLEHDLRGGITRARRPS